MRQLIKEFTILIGIYQRSEYENNIIGHQMLCFTQINTYVSAKEKDAQQKYKQLNSNWS